MLASHLLGGCGAGTFHYRKIIPMSSRFARKYSLGTLVTLALISGCTGTSGGNVPPLTALSPTAVLAPPAPSKLPSLIYTAQLYGEDVQVYKRSGNNLQWEETLTQGVSSPQGTQTTVNGWWYVANGGNSNVLIYRTKKNGPDKVPVSSLSDYQEIPVNVAVTPNRRLVGASNFSPIGGGNGSLSIYLNRQAVPARTLTFGSVEVSGAGVAIDHQGNCYWGINSQTSGAGSIVEFSGCSGGGSVLVSGIGNVGGLALDQKGDLFYVDRANDAIDECTSHGGKVSCSTFVSGYPLSKPQNINFDQHDMVLWVADASGIIFAINPKTGGITQTPAHGGPSDPPFGIAPEPGD